MQDRSTKLSRFLELPNSQKLLAFEAALILVGISFVLAILPYRAWRSRLRSYEPPIAPSGESLARARQIGFLVQSVARNLPGHPQCLAQALAARSMLKRRGIASALNIGVHQDRAALNAHAWLAVGGQIITGGPDVSKFSAFSELSR